MADFFDTFKARWKLANDAEKTQREHELEDLLFESGEHWDAKVKADRTAEGRPALTIDLLSGPIKTVTNQQRLARPGIKIAPVGQGTDIKKAELRQGIVRRVERLSQAARVYAWAGQYQVKMGRGFWVVRNLRVGDGFEQDIRIEEVDNQHTIYCDPTIKKLDGSDKKWAVRFEDLTHDDYVERFGESDLASKLSARNFQGTGDAPPDWITSRYCRIAEYHYLKSESRTKHLLSDGSQAWDDELEHDTMKKGRRRVSVPMPPEGLTIEQTRDVPQTKVHWCLLNGAGETLDEAIVPGKYIPVVQVYGERRNINGVVDYRGMVRMAKDPSRMEDFCESSLMESISLAKTAPWLAEWDQISEFYAIWQNSNRIPVGVLPYKRVSGQNGAPIPPPQRVPAGVDVTALTLAAQRMQNHVRNVTGNADVFQEETRQEQSGRAIRERKLNQELGTSDYLENLGDGIVLTAKIILSMAREVYDTPRLMRIIGNDEKERPIMVFSGEQNRPQQLEDGVEEALDLDEDDELYDIAISQGKRHDTARQETVDILTELVPRLPPPMQPPAVVALLKNLDGPGMAELAATLEPKQDDIPPEVAQKMQEMQQQLQQAIQIIETDQVKQAATLEKAKLDNETKVAVAELQSQQTRLLTLLEAKFSLIEQKLEHAHELRLEHVKQRHEVASETARAAMGSAEMERGHEQALEQSEAGHVHAIEQQAETPTKG